MINVDRPASEKLYTPEEVAEYFGFTPTWVRKMCREGKLKAVKIGPKGRQWRIKWEDVEELLKESMHPEEHPA